MKMGGPEKKIVGKGRGFPEIVNERGVSRFCTLKLSTHLYNK